MSSAKSKVCSFASLFFTWMWLMKILKRLGLRTSTLRYSGFYVTWKWAKVVNFNNEGSFFKEASYYSRDVIRNFYLHAFVYKAKPCRRLRQCQKISQLCFVLFRSFQDFLEWENKVVDSLPSLPETWLLFFDDFVFV